MFKRIKNAHTPKNFSPPEDWQLCNALIGAKSFIEAGEPIEFDEDLMPEWYAKLEDYDQLQKVWIAQEQYVNSLFVWMETKGATDAYFDDAHEADEAWLLEKYSIQSTGKFDWQPGMGSDLLKVNARNMYVRAVDGTMLLQYGTWETIFIMDPANTIPAELRQPTIRKEDI
jgi:hypothetical protein